MTRPPRGEARVISQDTFDDLVRDNMEELGMDPADALQDAIHTLTLQAVDLSGIVMELPEENGARDNSVSCCLSRVKHLLDNLNDQISDVDLDEMTGLFDKLADLCSIEGSGNTVIAVKNGGVESICLLCSKVPIAFGHLLTSALKALALFLCDVQGSDLFYSCNGPSILVHILKNEGGSQDILDGGFAVVAAAATRNEIVKESFMELNIIQLILQVLDSQTGGSIKHVYDAVRAIVTADDNRVVASQVYGYARRFSESGIVKALVRSLNVGQASSDLASAMTALKALAVNEEICKSIAESGGIDAIMKHVDGIDESNKIIAKCCCTLLSKLAGSDANKSAIVEKGGINKLIQLAGAFADEPSVLKEVMGVIRILCLRSPDIATRAVEAGAGDLAIQSMQKFPTSCQLQNSSCLMIRNLVARNPNNRLILLSKGVDALIRKARRSHRNCKVSATDALRDLGLNDYN